eukprot:11191821-Lingulodinium_polyedra.AAC.1
MLCYVLCDVARVGMLDVALVCAGAVRYVCHKPALGCTARTVQHAGASIFRKPARAGVFEAYRQCGSFAGFHNGSSNLMLPRGRTRNSDGHAVGYRLGTPAARAINGLGFASQPLMTWQTSQRFPRRANDLGSGRRARGEFSTRASKAFGSRYILPDWHRRAASVCMRERTRSVRVLPRRATSICPKTLCRDRTESGNAMSVVLTAFHSCSALIGWQHQILTERGVLQ